MGKKLFNFLLLGVLVVVTGCSRVIQLSYDTLEECNNKPQLVTGKDGRRVYTYCLDNVKVKVNNKVFDLSDYIDSNKRSIDRIIESLEYISSFDDGGTSIYKGDNITVIDCNTLSGNRDIYIGSRDMKFKSNFCKDNNYTFTRTYLVQDISKNEEGTTGYKDSYLAELYAFQGDREKVVINGLADMNLEKGKTYEFELMVKDGETIEEDNIGNIFKYADIVEIRETDKVGLDQIQEPIYKRD